MLTTITADDLRKKLQGDHDITVINVLDEAHFDAKHIPGSINIPQGEPNFINRVESVVSSHDHPIVVYCASTDCHASETAAKKLQQAGYRNIIDFEPGVQGWADAGFDLGGTDTRTL